LYKNQPLRYAKNDSDCWKKLQEKSDRLGIWNKMLVLFVYWNVIYSLHRHKQVWRWFRLCAVTDGGCFWIFKKHEDVRRNNIRGTGKRQSPFTATSRYIMTESRTTQHVMYEAHTSIIFRLRSWGRQLRLNTGRCNQANNYQHSRSVFSVFSVLCLLKSNIRMGTAVLPR